MKRIFPSDLKSLNVNEMQHLAQEIRDSIIDTISKTGGHLGAGLGVVELSIALHHVFDTPKDKIIWDVGHQSYPHKILTGRSDALHTIRQKNGLSGFCSIFESEYDVFGAGHSSTSISAGLGIATARDLNNENYSVISVIGDSAMTAGMAYEGINNAGHLGTKMIVILNDNDMSIAPAVGALRNYLVRMISSTQYINIRQFCKKIVKNMPFGIPSIMKKAEIAAKDVIIGDNIFEALGFYYIGPVNGHNISDLVSIFKRAKSINIDKPILIHVKTEKGKGYTLANNSKDKCHAVTKIDINKEKKTTYTDIFASTLINMAKNDSKILAITAAMPDGTGLAKFAQEFPNRMFDVAISEQHAVTFAAGLAISGYKPFCAIYSTFLQRAYDQIIHDVAIQNLPVRFCIDRAGYVGADGATHCGSFDVVMLANIPNIVVMAPANYKEFIGMLKLLNDINDKPSAIRYPRCEIAESISDDHFMQIQPVEIGKMQEIVPCGTSNVCIISYGTMLENCQNAVEKLNLLNIKCSLFNSRFAKPLDHEMLTKIANSCQYIITVEEGASGGFGAIVSEFINNNCNKQCKVYQIHMPDKFLSHASISQQHIESNLDTESIVRFIQQILY